MQQPFITYKLNYFDPIENSNKVWIGEAYTNGDFISRYGRVREGANLAETKKNFGMAWKAEAELEKKKREKLKKGYRETQIFDGEVTIQASQPKNLSKIAKEQIGGTDDKTTLELIEYLAKVNIHNITSSTNIKYNASNATFSTPLGVLTPDAVKQARILLTNIKQYNRINFIDSPTRQNYIRDYFQVVPRDFGARIPNSKEILNDKSKIQKEISILDALESALQTNDLGTTEKLFECRLTKIPHWTEEGKQKFREIRKLYESTKNASHVKVANLKLSRVYEVEIVGMKREFEKTSAKLGNIRQDLWHGTKASNLLSILKSGLQIPKSSASHCTGRMFGDGIYTSLQSSKALNYATDFWNGSGAKNQKTFMFLCEASLGKIHKPQIRSGSFPKRGTNSTWVEAGTCGVMNHECIVYDLSQINLRYLCEFEAN